MKIVLQHVKTLYLKKKLTGGFDFILTLLDIIGSWNFLYTLMELSLQDLDEITATLQVGNTNISTKLIPNNTTPDVDVSSAVVHHASILTM